MAIRGRRGCADVPAATYVTSVGEPRQPRQHRGKPEWVAYLPSSTLDGCEELEPFAEISTIYCGRCLDQLTDPSWEVLLWAYVLADGSVWPMAPDTRTGYRNVAKRMEQGQELVNRGYAVGRSNGLRAPSRTGLGDTLELLCFRSGHELGRVKHERLSNAVRDARAHGCWQLAVRSGGRISELSNGMQASWRESGVSRR
jgi:hypothetical protein